jgi:DNA-directed RNA polymerase subunit beta'
VSDRMLERFKEYIGVTEFNAIRIGLINPEVLLALSYGEVKKIETINYRTLKPERDGLFCARIFGPVKDWECNCGKYKRMKHRGVTCEKCGVEVIQSRVRRERMGHIKLVSPVCHIWYLKGIPSYLSLIMDIPVRDLERVIYFDIYMVVKQGKSPYAQKTLVSSQEIDAYLAAHPEDKEFQASIGATAIDKIIKDMDLKLELELIAKEYSETSSIAVRHKLMRRIKVLSGLLRSNIRPEWMILKILPVLPPDLRPLVPLEGGRFASSDRNELYRRVLNRNIRLERLIEISAPRVIVQNEQRMLQEAVDALIDNGRRGAAVRGQNRRILQSLSEMLRGKQGRFRQNLLGRRVDYSGRSVIVVDPTLKMHQCGIPKTMALELFKPYVYAGLVEREYAASMKIAKRMVEEFDPIVWSVLEDVVKNHPVLLNRAPTLHRLGIQSFYPILVDGKAIKIHPLVCAAFNADFDGDQMAVHIPLSRLAQLEAKTLYLSVNNILSPANGKPLTTPTQDMVLGLYYLTKMRRGLLGEGTVFGSAKEVITAYECSAVKLHAEIKLRINNKIETTTVGRVVLYDALPEETPFEWVNLVMKKKQIEKLIERIYYHFGRKLTVLCLDKIKQLGFNHATFGGISFSLGDLIIPKRKEAILKKAEDSVEAVENLYMDGIITNGERYNKVLGIWENATASIADEMQRDLEKQDAEVYENADASSRPFNSIFLMLDSGARGTKDQIKQLIGMRGLMANPKGEIMERPIKSNFKEGLRPFEYFTSTHGARKGQADTAIKTANAGYLTRKLADVAHDVVITMHDCKTLGSIEIRDLEESGDIIYPLSKRVFGRTVAVDIKDPISGALIFPQGHIVSRKDLDVLENSAVSKIQVRSVLTCQAKRGICALCYGFDLSQSELVEVGTTVGIIAAQSIGEPGTQLTMRTFHIGGTASGIGQKSSFHAKHDGFVSWRGIQVIKNQQNNQVCISRRARIVVVSKDGRDLQSHHIEYGAAIFVTDGQEIKNGTKLVEWDPNNKVLLTQKAGYVKFVDIIDGVTCHERINEVTKKSNYVIAGLRDEKYQPAIQIYDEADNEIANYFLPEGAYLNVTNGQKVNLGDILIKIPREMSKSKDITTGGLPRIAELFEARAPKDPAIIADIDGQAVIGDLHRGMRKISIVSGADSYDYLVPRGKTLNVTDGEHVKAGDQITSGTPVIQDMLRILGPARVQRYLVDQIQEIYRLQGVDLNDKHLELIVRQMMRKVIVVEIGNSNFLIGDRVDKIQFQTVNAILKAEGKKTATAKPMIVGLTQASLNTESFISAASFQETTRILAEAAMSGQVDPLLGLKENVIVGKLIPAGTGIKSFREKHLQEKNTALE